MKKSLLLVFTLMFIATLLMAATTTVTPTRSSASNDKEGTRLETIAWQETFETGPNGWNFYDATSPAYMWRNYNSTADGWVWWMGDTSIASGANIGGYLDSQYLVFDTPAVTVPTANPTLTFRVKYKVEAPAGATAPYTGWDACNVRISTNGGTTWTVISGTPAYNITSAYSFGFEHNEGPNIAGWGGNSNGWQNASFSLSAYAGQSVKIRFAFASDPEYCTSDDATMFGMMVDNIVIGDLNNDGSTNVGFTSSSMVPLGGQLWHIDVADGAPSPTHAMVLQNDQNTYNINMLDYVTSPSIALPEAGQIKADFQIQGDFTDTGTFPDVDFWGWEISPDDGITWYPMSNPYNDPNGNNYVFSDAPTTWSSAVESYSLDGMISDYAGQTVKFRVYFKSNASAAGTGMMFDDFTIYNVLFLAPPTNLISSVNAGTVDLAWTAPVGGVTPTSITSTNENWSSFVSDADSYAMKITNPNATETQLHGVNVMIYRQNSMPIVGTPTLHVWADAAGLPGTELLNVPNVTNIENMVWKNVDITNSNIMIPANGSIFIGVSGIDPGDATNAQGLLCDATSTTPNSFASTAGAWSALSATYTGLVNCGLSATIWVADPGAPTLTGFKVWHSLDAGLEFTEIANITNPATVTYADTAPISGVVNYYKVTGVYNTNQSDPTNISSVFVLGADFSEVMYDDNDVDMGYNVGATKSMAVKFDANPTPGHGSQIQFAKVFVNTVGTSSMIIRVWDANGTDGLPGTQLLQFTYASTGITQGWNTIPMPTSNLITDEDGIFYIGILEYVGASAIGLDSDTHNSSWKKLATASPWEQITEGNLLIRAIVREVVGNDDIVELAPVMNLNSYPNPFNPSTTISFNVPKAGTGSVKIYNVKGQLVRTLVSGNLTVGQHKIVWEGTNDNGQGVGSGIYFTKFETAGKTLTQKMVLVK